MLTDKYLSKNFSLQEFIVSQTASRLGIDNTPPDWAEANLRALCDNVLQPLRDEYGHSVFISSGYRSPSLNTAIGGSSTSQHMTGQAADIQCADNLTLFAMIYKHHPFDQLIWEFGTKQNPDWVHVSFNQGKNRRQVLRAVRENGVTRYETWQL